MLTHKRSSYYLLSTALTNVFLKNPVPIAEGPNLSLFHSAGLCVES